MFLSSKAVYYYDFWRSRDTEEWSNDAENTVLITEINYSLTDIHIETAVLNHNNIWLFLLYLWSNKCSLDDQKRLISTLNNLDYAKHLNLFYWIKHKFFNSISTW